MRKVSFLSCSLYCKQYGSFASMIKSSLKCFVDEKSRQHFQYKNIGGITVNIPTPCILNSVFYDFINLTQVHNFTVNAQDIFTLSGLPLFTVSFTGN